LRICTHFVACNGLACHRGHSSVPVSRGPPGRIALRRTAFEAGRSVDPLAVL